MNILIITVLCVIVLLGLSFQAKLAELTAEQRALNSEFKKFEKSLSRSITNIEYFSKLIYSILMMEELNSGLIPPSIPPSIPTDKNSNPKDSDGLDALRKLFNDEIKKEDDEGIDGTDGTDDEDDDPDKDAPWKQ